MRKVHSTGIITQARVRKKENATKAKQRVTSLEVKYRVTSGKNHLDQTSISPPVFKVRSLQQAVGDEARLQTATTTLESLKSHYNRFFSSNNGFHRALTKGSTPSPKNELASRFSMPQCSLPSCGSLAAASS